jgi:sortase A
MTMMIAPLLDGAPPAPVVVVSPEPGSVPPPGQPRLRRRSFRFPARGSHRVLPPAAAAVVVTLVGVGILAVWSVAYLSLLSPLKEARGQRIMYTSFRQDIQAGILPPNTPARQGKAVALISLPGADLHNVVIVEGTTGVALSRGPGHRRGTPLPGEAGVSIVYGKSLTFGGPFGHLSSLRNGDKATVVTQEGTFTYLVDRVRRVGDPGEQPLPTGGGRLELITSTGSGTFAELSRSRPLYVDLTLQGRALPSTAPANVTLANSEKLMGRDTAPLVNLVLGLQLLLVISGAGIWAYRRWSVPQLWLVGTPAVLAALWWVSTSACQLLPNLY